MNRGQLINEALRLPPSAIPYYVHNQLAELFPDKALLECDERFDIEDYVKNGQCTMTLPAYSECELLTYWEEPDEDDLFLSPEGRLVKQPYNAWLDLTWQEKTLTLLSLHWETGDTTNNHHWLLADTEAIANQFVEAVGIWNAEIRGEILVFDDGCWNKDEHLFQAIKNSTFDNLILEASLKQDILSDLEQFFASREVYTHYHIPWKRGLLFVGTPGNGKTHTIKALINTLKKPCLYVKSFKTQYGAEDRNIRNVFARARKAAPCILVLEDLDSLLTDDNRSFFLNELDGFAANIGIVILATTNHPERLDPSILDRPSRFDRKYPFNLPALPERIAYITFWNTSLQATMRLSEYAIADLAHMTNDFSFAYLKELFLSSIMRWATADEKDMDKVMFEQTMLLQQQMAPSVASSQ